MLSDIHSNIYALDVFMNHIGLKPVNKQMNEHHRKSDDMLKDNSALEEVLNMI